MKIIAGPCQHESLKQSLIIAKTCKLICEAHGVEYYFKASYDKANRTSAASPRGLGLYQTLRDFLKMKKEIPDLKIVTDFHDEWAIDAAFFDPVVPFDDAFDVIQIPALLSRQTDLIRGACDTGKIVNVKKGQFMSPKDVMGILTKTSRAKEVWITERGTMFGYNNLIVDFTGLEEMMGEYEHYEGVHIVFDATHAVQKPGAGDGVSGGLSPWCSKFLHGSSPRPRQCPE